MRKMPESKVEREREARDRGREKIPNNNNNSYKKTAAIFSPSLSLSVVSFNVFHMHLFVRIRLICAFGVVRFVLPELGTANERKRLEIGQKTGVIACLRTKRISK